MPGQRFVERRDAEVRVEGVGQPPGEYLAAVPVHDGHEVDEAPGHRKVRHIGAPHLVGAFDGETAQAIGVDLVCVVRTARVRPRIQGVHPHRTHQPLHALAIHHPSLVGQRIAYAAAAVEGPAQMNLVHGPHQGAVPFRDRRHRPVVRRRARHVQQRTAPRDRKRVL